MALAAALAACAVATGDRFTSSRVAYATYEERRGDLTVVLDGRPASVHPEEDYVPIHVAIGRGGGAGSLRVTLETFVLIDRDGNAYPAATPQEIRRHHPFVTLDRRLLRARPLALGHRFAASDPVSSDFYGARGPAAPLVYLSAFTWFDDLVYFPRPAAGLDDVLTLRLHGGGIDPPLEIRFRIPQR